MVQETLREGNSLNRTPLLEFVQLTGSPVNCVVICGPEKINEGGEKDLFLFPHTLCWTEGIKFILLSSGTGDVVPYEKLHSHKMNAFNEGDSFCRLGPPLPLSNLSQPNYYLYSRVLRVVSEFQDNSRGSHTHNKEWANKNKEEVSPIICPYLESTICPLFSDFNVLGVAAFDLKFPWMASLFYSC